MNLKPHNISSCVVIFYNSQRKELFNSLERLDLYFLKLNPKNQVQFLLYVSQTNDTKTLNRDILKSVITYIKATARFDRSLINLNQ